MKPVVVFVVFLGVARTVYGQCNKPEGKENMRLDYSGSYPVAEGTVLTFACNVGYKPKGSGKVNCTNGQWSTLQMICEIKNCGSYGEINNGYVDYSQGTEFGAKITLVCNDGYYPAGRDTTAFCGDSGEWDNRLSPCESIKCDPPKQIANGSYAPVEQDYSYRQVVTYSCNGKLQLNGSKSLMCSQNSKFEPQPPNCVYVECTYPNIGFGMIVSGSRPPFEYKSSVTLKCLLGYDMQGSENINCDINSRWNPPLPTCNLIQCTSPNISNGGVVGEVHPKYNFSQSVKLSCANGYKLEGADELTCEAMDRWSANLPTCTRSGSNHLMLGIGIGIGIIIIIIIIFIIWWFGWFPFGWFGRNKKGERVSPLGSG